MKDAYYFSHDSNARHDPKILSLISKFGMSAYGQYWVIIEILREQKDYRFPLKLKDSLTMQLHCDNKAITELLDYMFFVELLHTDKTHFWSQSLNDRMNVFLERRKRRSFAGKKGMESRWKKAKNLVKETNSDNNVITKNNNVITSKVKESKVNKSKGIKYIVDFEKIWEQYPNKDGKKQALNHYKRSVKTSEDVEKIWIALENYKNSSRVKKGFVKNGSTWFNNWRDWVDYIEPEKEYENPYIIKTE